MSTPAVTGEMPLGAWLRREREKRGWGRRETARRLIQAGKAAVDTAMPSVDSMCTYVRSWERGTGVTERYQLYYCKAFGMAAAQFGSPDVPGADSLSPIAAIRAYGLSVSLQYTSGRFMIEISGLQAPEQEAGPGHGLSLVPSPGPQSYGGRA
ncbi:MAG TPA: hypothetical protein VN969_06365 [Streptosporangiaceae bacterium]|jgi:hypothetical protein|nr:hypothetical protein [Streptosporangiaceae bacterium]